MERAEGRLEDPARAAFYFCPGRRILRAVDASEPVFEPRVVRNVVVEKRRSPLPSRKEPPRRGANLPPPDQDALVVDIGGVAPGKTHPPVTEARPELPNLGRRGRVDHPAEVRNADISDRIRRLHGEEVAAVPELRVGLLARTRGECSRPGGPIQLAGRGSPRRWSRTRSPRSCCWSKRRRWRSEAGQRASGHAARRRRTSLKRCGCPRRQPRSK